MSTRDAAGRTPARPSPVRRGATDSVAVIVAYIPFGLTLGASMAATGVPPLVAWSSSPLMFGGAGQLLAVQMLGAGANAAVVVLAALVVNARFLLYSASLAEYAATWPRRLQWAGAYLLADPVYALATARFAGPGGGGPPRERMAYYVAVGATLWAAWQVFTGLGVLLAGVLPAGLRLDLAAPQTFLLLLLPMLTSRPAWGARRRARGSPPARSWEDVMRDLLILVAIGLGTYTIALAFLVVHGGSPQTRQRIAATFWPDSTDEQALTNLRRELHHLRGALGACRGRGERRSALHPHDSVRRPRRGCDVLSPVVVSIPSTPGIRLAAMVYRALRHSATPERRGWWYLARVGDGRPDAVAEGRTSAWSLRKNPRSRAISESWSRS